MSWAEIKHALNSTLGTGSFKSLNLLIKDMVNTLETNIGKKIDGVSNHIDAIQSGYQIFTATNTWTVPNGVTKIYISGCGAGGDGVNSNCGKAGQYIIRDTVSVVPGQKINLTIGTGNTVISTNGYSKTLTANSLSESHQTTILGYLAGINGGNAPGYYDSPGSYGGYGGAFGYGGGAGAAGGSETSKNHGGGSGSMLGISVGSKIASAYAGADGLDSSYRNGVNGGDAGGFGAGGGGGGSGYAGSNGNPGKGSSGVVIIEWGNLRDCII